MVSARRPWFVLALSWCLVCLISTAALADVRVTTWNMKHLGRKNQDLVRVAALLQDADAVVLQEVNSTKSGATALAALSAELTKLTGATYCTALSEIPTDARERYAMLYREDRLAYVTTNGRPLEKCAPYALTLRLGSKGAAKIVREPAVGLFRENSSGKKFWLVTVHTVPTAKKPALEVPHVFEAADAVAGKVPVVVAGDFNLSCNDRSFGPSEKSGYLPAVGCATKTSLKQRQRVYNAAYDNIYTRGLRVSDARLVDVFDRYKDLPVQDIYRDISDHAPVTAVIGFTE